jgi:CO/xanthine dehydrogenase Mo-binding subunit
VKSAAACAGGIALANSLRSAPTPCHIGLIAAPAAESKYQKHILIGEVKQYGDLQVFELKDKDARGFDWTVQMSPVDAIPMMNEPVAVDADRVKAYIGGDPKNVEDIGTQIEVSMGNEPEVYTIDSATVTYITKGIPHRQRVLKKATRESFVLTLTLPPKYVEPAKSQKL